MTRLGRYYRKLFMVAAEKKLWMRVLGEIDGHQIWFLRTKDTQSHNYPRLLIVGGFHGEEQAGPLGILSWLETFDPNLYTKVNLSF
ncbi:MAG: hypothetical protein EHM49_08280, partial [Deltaproteobacteria bacterium]